jgi:hypothetical protein
MLWNVGFESGSSLDPNLNVLYSAASLTRPSRPQATQSPIYLILQNFILNPGATLSPPIHPHSLLLSSGCQYVWIICTNSPSALVQGMIVSAAAAWSQSNDCFLGCSQHRCAIQHRNQNTKYLQINMVCVRDHPALIPCGRSPLLWWAFISPEYGHTVRILLNNENCFICAFFGT